MEMLFVTRGESIIDASFCSVIISCINSRVLPCPPVFLIYVALNMEEKKQKAGSKAKPKSETAGKRTIFDVFRFRGTPYKHLDDRYAKKRIESWVSKLSADSALVKSLIDSNGFIDISPANSNAEYTHEGIPAELFAEVLKITFPEFL